MKILCIYNGFKRTQQLFMNLSCKIIKWNYIYYDNYKSQTKAIYLINFCLFCQKNEFSLIRNIFLNLRSLLVVKLKKNNYYDPLD